QGTGIARLHGEALDDAGELRILKGGGVEQPPRSPKDHIVPPTGDDTAEPVEGIGPPGVDRGVGTSPGADDRDSTIFEHNVNAELHPPPTGAFPRRSRPEPPSENVHRRVPEFLPEHDHSLQGVEKRMLFLPGMAPD